MYVYMYVWYVCMCTYMCLYACTYGMHQLQLKSDTLGTRKGHACYTRIFLVIYTRCKLPSCIGLHTSSLFVYTQGSFLHAHACAQVDTL